MSSQIWLVALVRGFRQPFLVNEVCTLLSSSASGRYWLSMSALEPFHIGLPTAAAITLGTSESLNMGFSVMSARLWNLKSCLCWVYCPMLYDAPSSSGPVLSVSISSARLPVNSTPGRSATLSSLVGSFPGTALVTG